MVYYFYYLPLHSHQSAGRDIDPIAREPLWQNGLDYKHATFHGIGHFLNIHEGTRIMLLLRGYCTSGPYF